jgi:rubrerythrin
LRTEPRVLTDAELEALIDHIRGTVKSLDDGLEALGYEEDLTQLAQESLERIDAELFWCETCGWCCGRDEESDEPEVCDDCAD